ncbi:hypothetical protein ACS0TY_034460 [Phlomoides rotata]
MMGMGGVTEHDNSENEGGSGEGRIPRADYKGEKPILTMLEWIREWLMMRFQHNRDNAAMKWKGRVCPKIRQILNKHIEASTTCRPIKADNIHYQVRVNDGSQHIINLEDHTCSCRL